MTLSTLFPLISGHYSPNPMHKEKNAYLTANNFTLSSYSYIRSLK